MPLLSAWKKLLQSLERNVGRKSRRGRRSPAELQVETLEPRQVFDAAPDDGYGYYQITSIEGSSSGHMIQGEAGWTAQHTLTFDPNQKVWAQNWQEAVRMLVHGSATVYDGTGTLKYSYEFDGTSGLSSAFAVGTASEIAAMPGVSGNDLVSSVGSANANRALIVVDDQHGQQTPPPDSDYDDAYVFVNITKSVPVGVSVHAGANAAEGSSAPGTFVISLDQAYTEDVTVNFTLSGNANNGGLFSDYSPDPSGFVVIAAGQTYATVEIAAYDDIIPESQENVTLEITSVATGGSGSGGGSGGSGSGSGPQISTTDYRADIYIDDNDCTGPICPPCMLCDAVAIVEQTGAALVNAASGFLKWVSDTNPHPIVEFQTELPSGQPAPEKIKVEFWFGGVKQTFNIGAGTPPDEIWYDTSTLSAGDPFKLVLQADATGMGSGRHKWIVKVTPFVAGALDTDHAREFHGYQEVVDNTASTLGNRWSVAELDRLVRGTDGVTLVKGSGGTFFFQKPTDWSPTYALVAGDPTFSELRKNDDGSYTLTAKDLSLSKFDKTGLLIERRDASGNRTTYTYDDGDGDGVKDEIFKITDPSGRVRDFHYANDRVESITDTAGPTITLGYDSVNPSLLVSVTTEDPDGPTGPGTAATTTFQYNSDSLLTTIFDAGARTTSFEYDDYHAVEAVTLPCDCDYTYAAIATQGLPDASLGAGTISNPAALPSLGPREGERIAPDASGALVKTTYTTDRFGNYLTVTDPAGRTTTYERNANGQVTKMIQPSPDGTQPGPVTQYFYNDAGNLTKIIDPEGGIHEWKYDEGVNFAKEYIDPSGVTTLYDVFAANGWIKSMRQVVGTEDPADDIKTSYEYTPQYFEAGHTPGGLLAEVTDPLGRKTKFEYDASGNLTKVIRNAGASNENNWLTTEYSYDLLNRLDVSTDELGRQTKYTYDVLNRLVQITLPNPSNGSPTGPTIKYEYDGLDRVVRMTEMVTATHSRETTYAYLDHGRQVQITTADHDGDGLPTVTYVQRDSRGNQIASLDALGGVTVYSYSTTDELIAATLPDPDGPGGPLTGAVYTMSYDALGRLVSVTDPSATPNEAPRVVSAIADSEMTQGLTTPRVIDLRAVFQDVQADEDSAGMADATNSDGALRFEIVSNTNPAIVQNMTIDDAGKLTITWVTGAIGTAEFVVRATDAAGASAVDTFKVEIKASTTAETTIDDGSAGFSTTGTWTAGPAGHDGDSKQSSATGAVATWAFSSLSSGWQEVEIYLPASASSATAAEYTIKSGNDVLGRVTLNQRAVSAGGWISLGSYLNAGTGLTVEVVRLNGTGNLIADAVRVKAAAGLTATTTKSHDDGDLLYTETVGTWSNSSLGGTQGGDARYSNSSGATARFSFINLAPGWHEVFVANPEDGQSVRRALFTLESAGHVIGQVGIDQEQPIAEFVSLGVFFVAGSTLDVSVERVGSGYLRADSVRVQSALAPTGTEFTVDDGDPWYSLVGAWSPSNVSGAYQGDSDLEGGGSTGASSALWSFTGVPAGDYEVYVTWRDNSNRASNAPYKVFDGETEVASRTINQKVAPVGLTYGGTTWQSLGVFDFSHGWAQVKLTNLANGYVSADAVRIVRRDPAPVAPPAVVIVDNGDAAHSLTGTWTGASSSDYYQGDAATAAAGTGTRASTWNFASLPAGDYEVYVTYSLQSNRATNAPYTVYDGTTSLSTVAVDQKSAPADEVVGATGWKSLGVFELSSGSAKVVLTDNANGVVSADAVRLVRRDAVPADAFRIVDASPGENVIGKVDRVVVTFNRAVNAATFTVADVLSITGPNNSVIAATGVVQLSQTQFAVTFLEQTAVGAYSLVIGPNIKDASRTKLDNDRDRTTNESVDDRFVVHFNIAAAGRTGASGTTYEYDLNGRTTKVTDAAGGVVRYEYDPAGRLKKTTDQLNRVTTYKYDSVGRLIEVAQPDLDLGDSLPGPTTKYEYDKVGNVTKVTDALGRETVYTYDAFDRLVKTTLPPVAGPGGTFVTSELEFQYYKNGLLKSETDALGRMTSYAYDKLNRLVAVTHPDLNESDSVPPTTTLYDHDFLGRVTKVTDAEGRETFYKYDDHDNVTEITLPDPDTSTTPAPKWKFTYNDAGQVLTEEDPLHRVTTYTYDKLGRLLSVTQPDPDGTAGSQTSPLTTYRYDAVGNVTSIRETRVMPVGQTDANARTTEFLYDELYRRIAVIDAMGGVSSVQYDDASQTTAEVDRLGRRTTYSYDVLGRVTEVGLPDPDGTGGQAAPTWQYQYDAVGNLTKQIDPGLDATDYEYDALDRLTKTTLPAVAGVNPVWEYDYDKAGQLLSLTDPLNHTTSYGYDALGRTVSVQQPGVVDGYGNPAAWVYSYDDVGNLIQVVDPRGHATGYEYDVLDRLKQTTAADPDGSSGPLASPITTYAYDDAGQLTSVAAPPAAGHSQPTTTSYVYDDLGRTTSVTTPLSGTTTYLYDQFGNVVQATDAQSHHTTAVYDALNRRTSSSDALGATTAYEYDREGNLTSLTDPVGNKTEWRYDGLDRIVRETNPLGANRTYQYDADSNLTQLTDRNGRVTEYAYDALDRQTSEVWKNGSTTANTISYGYDLADRLTSAGDAATALTLGFTYDALGRVLTADNNVGNANSATKRVVLTNTYDAAGNRSSVSAAVGVTSSSAGVLDFKNEYAYDALNRMTSVTQRQQTGGNVVDEKRVRLNYDALGRFTSIVRYSDAAMTNEVVASSYGYNSAGRLTSLTHTDGPDSRAAYSYTYDAVGRIASKTIQGESTFTYTYDATGQLIGTDDGTSGTADDKVYDYDANGNRESAGYVTGPNNQLISDGVYVYTYDAEGNRTSRRAIATGVVETYSWDHRNRLTSVVTTNPGSSVSTETVSFTYDAFDRRNSTSVDADGAGGGAAQIERYVYDGDQIALVFKDSVSGSRPVNRYLYGPVVDQVFADEQWDGTSASTLWTLADELGTIRDLAVDSGTVSNHIKYDSFGNVTWQTTSSVKSRYGYTGRELQAEIGLQYNRHRWYDAAVGRWASEDPIGFKAGDLNLNRYVGNSAPMFSDPSGLEWGNGGWIPTADEIGANWAAGQVQQGFRNWVWVPFVEGYPEDQRTVTQQKEGWKDWKPYMPPTAHDLGLPDGEEIADAAVDQFLYQPEKFAFNVTVQGASIFCEPIDYILTAHEIYRDPYDKWSYASLLPFLTAGMGRLAKDVGSLADELPANKLVDELPCSSLNDDLGRRDWNREWTRPTEPTVPLGSQPRGEPKSTGPEIPERQRASNAGDNEGARVMAENGYDVLQRPELGRGAPQGVRNPDFAIDGAFADAYTPFGNVNTINTTLYNKTKSGQAKRFVVVLDNVPNVTPADVRRSLNGKRHAEMDEVFLIRDGAIIDVIRF